MSWTACTLFIIFIFSAAATAVDFNYPAVFNFGDSNSDTGNLVAGLGHNLEPPYGQTYFHKPSGRFCDGRMIIDFLMDAMDLPLLNPYLDSIAAPIFKRGCNFAAGGATIFPPPTSGCPFSFDIQVAQFLRFKAKAVDILTTSRKYDKYLPAQDYLAKALYTFDIGQNDLAGAFYSYTTLDQVLAYIPIILSAFQDGIQKLYDQGARNLWIHNTGPLGCLPQNIAMYGGDLDELGCVASQNQVSKLFNLQLHALCRKLQGQYQDVNVTYVDIYTIKSNLIANYSRYGNYYNDLQNRIHSC